MLLQGLVQGDVKHKKELNIETKQDHIELIADIKE